MFGGSAELRDLGLLEFALNMPMAIFGQYYLHDNLFKMADAYLFHLIKNHAFVDGNKRTAIVVCLTVLKANDVKFKATQDQIFDLAIGVATSTIPKEEIESILKSFTKL